MGQIFFKFSLLNKSCLCHLSTLPNQMKVCANEKILVGGCELFFGQEIGLYEYVSKCVPPLACWQLHSLQTQRLRWWSRTLLGTWFGPLARWTHVAAPPSWTWTSQSDFGHGLVGLLRAVPPGPRSSTALAWLLKQRTVVCESVWNQQHRWIVPNSSVTPYS